MWGLIAVPSHGPAWFGVPDGCLHTQLSLLILPSYNASSIPYGMLESTLEDRGFYRFVVREQSRNWSVPRDPRVIRNWDSGVWVAVEVGKDGFDGGGDVAVASEPDQTVEHQVHLPVGAL